ncbi:hypothetical protein ACYULU_09290, partial [Breznakiellaceae bacterium SP9]
RTHSAFSSTRFPIPSNSLNAVPNIPSLIPQVYIIFPKIKTAGLLTTNHTCLPTGRRIGRHEQARRLFTATENQEH